MTAILKPHWPGMRPEGMGRLGSLMASTCRSNQSFTAWLLAHTKGPHSTKPAKISSAWSEKLWPEATTPQAKAHMGGNHVMGLSSSATVAKEGREAISMLPLWQGKPKCQQGLTLSVSIKQTQAYSASWSLTMP
jgi:hypothetical protein